MASSQRSVAAMILSSDRSRILLVKRRDIPVWVMPGGGIEENETPEDAVLREAQEETGYQVGIDRLIALYRPRNRLTKTTFFFECSVLKGDALINPEASAVSFFPLDDLPKRLPPPYPEWISDAAKNCSEPLEKTIQSATYPSLIKHFLLHPLLVSRFLLTRMGIHLNYD